MSNVATSGIANEGVGIAKEKVNTADTAARPGVNSLEREEHQAKVDRIAEDSARRAMNRQAHQDGGVFTK